MDSHGNIGHVGNEIKDNYSVYYKSTKKLPLFEFGKSIDSAYSSKHVDNVYLDIICRRLEARSSYLRFLRNKLKNY